MSHKFSRREMLKGLALVGAGAVAAACVPVEPGQSASQAGDAGSMAEEITIEWWTINLKKNFGEIMQGYIDDFEAAHPGVTIEWVDVPGNEVARKYATALAGGTPPDVANMYQVPRFIELGAVRELDDLISAEEQEKFGGYWKQGAIGGKHYAVPWYATFARPTIVNGVLLNEAGVDMTNPLLTWQEIFEIGRQAQGTWAEGVIPFIDCWYPTQSWAIEEGLDIIDAEGTQATVNTPEWESHIQTLLDLHNEGLLSTDGYACPDPRTAIDWFWQELGSAITSGPWILNRTSLEVLEALEVDVWPTTVGSANRIAADAQVFVVSKQSAHPDIAAEFALFVSQTEQFIPFGQAVAIAPTYLPALDDPFFTEPPAEEPADTQQALIRKGIEVGIQDLKRVEIQPRTKPFFYWTTLTEDVPKLVSEEELAMVEGDLPVADFLARWEEELNLAIEDALAKGVF